MEEFTAITFEVMIAGVWVNVSADVLQNPAPSVNGMGISGSGVLDRIGSVGTLTFALDNSTGNSAATLGYYTPGGANALSGWSSGGAVRLTFTYEGLKNVAFFGTINTDGLTVETGKYKGRKVLVSASNWMRKAADHKVDLLGYQQNQTFDTATEFILQNMAVRPQATKFSTGAITFPTVFDITRVNTAAIGEINKLVMSEWGRAFISPEGTGETLVLQDKDYRANNDVAESVERDNGKIIPVNSSAITDYILLNDNTNLLLNDNTNMLMNTTQYAAFTEADIEDIQWGWGTQIYNKATFKTYPRRIDAAATTVLWTLEEPITLAAGEQIADTRGTYRDPNGGFAKVNGIEMVTPVINTDYKMFENADATGTDYTTSLGIVATYGTADVSYVLTNNAGVTAYVTTLQARGKGVYIYDTSDKTYTEATSINTYGVIPLEIDMPYLNDISLLDLGTDVTIWTSAGLLYAVSFAKPEVNGVKMTVNKSGRAMMAFMTMRPMDYMIINDTVTARPGAGGFGTYGEPFYVQGWGFTIKLGKYVEWDLTMRIQGVA